MSIISTSRLFHTITIDFILVLFDELNIIMFVICKHFRKTSLIFDKEIYDVKKWINALLNRFLIINWDISKVIIFDRDFKFMSNLWQIFFIRLNIRLLVVIAYHSQIDEISERTNQIVKIAIRYFIIKHSNIDYVLIFSSIQAQFNNSFNTVIDLISNEMIYDFKIKNALFNITKINTVNAQDLSIQRLKYQRKMIDAIVFATTKTKIYYDVRHTSILLNENDYVYLRLNKNYKLSKRFNSKLSQQRCDFFKILQRVERLTYKLNLSSTWRVHSIIFIAQLKSILVDFDSYQRLRFHHSDSAKMKRNTNEYRFYEIDKFKLIVKSSFKFEWVDLIRLASRKFRFEFELESSSSSWHVKRFELESSFKSRRQDLIWIWFKFQVSMSNLTWFVKNFNFMTYYIISRYF